jgi:hypothetical protein
LLEHPSATYPPLLPLPQAGRGLGALVAQPIHHRYAGRYHKIAEDVPLALLVAGQTVIRGAMIAEPDSTAQFLDWFKTLMGAFEHAWREAEKLQVSGIVSVFPPLKPEYAIGSMEWQAEQQRKKDQERSQ